MTILSTSSFYDGAMSSMASLQSQATTLQSQITSGNRLQASSDDPVAAAQLRSLAQADAVSKTDLDNSNTAQTNLNLADTALTSITNVVQNIQTLATQAASSTVSDSQRANIGTQIASLQTSLLSLANSRDSSGNALFGGETAGAAYAVDASGNATYAGSASAPQVSLGSGLTVTGGVTGPQVFSLASGGTATDLLAVVKTLASALQSGTGGQAAAQTAMTQLSSGLTQVGTAQTMVGARLAWIDTTNTIRTQITQQRTQQEADVGGADITATVTRLSQITTALQASQASFVKLSGLSLFSLIQ
jgi:flagellar hook-associated protein 3 FlgL